MPVTNISAPDPHRLTDPKHWRDKAEEARAKSEEMADKIAKATMRKVADTYDHLAHHAEHNDPWLHPHAAPSLLGRR